MNNPVLPPNPERREHTQLLHGELRADPWHWLREAQDPAVLAHLRAENAYCAAWFAPFAGLQEALYAEMLGRIQEDDASVPYRQHGWWWGSHTRKGLAYPIYTRTADTPGATAETLLDLNALAEGKPYLDLGELEVSPDGRTMAYSLDETGGLEYTLKLRDLATGHEWPTEIALTDAVAWGNDSKTLYYLGKDEAMRTYRLWRHVLGSDAPDAMLFEEADETFWLGLHKTRDDRYLVLGSHSKDTSQLWLLDANDPAATLQPVLPRTPGVEMSLDHRDGQLFVLINDTGRNFRLVTLDAAAPDLSRAHEVVPHRDAVTVEDVDVFAQHLVLLEREDARQRLRVFSFASATWHDIDLGDAVCAVGSQANAESNTTEYRYSTSSLVQPHTVWGHDMATGESRVLKVQAVLGGFDATHYRSERRFARASDGTPIPMTLVYRLDRFDDADPKPLLLYGYGAYGMPLDPSFSSTRLSLLDRGAVFALAHVRGGGDAGRAWYDAGKLAHKINSFTDLIACAEALIADGTTAPERLILEGGSAGGLLVAGAMALRPDLMKAVVAEVPFVDVINTMLDESLPLTVGEFLEWGNPKKADEYAWMRAYSPIDNLKPAVYPAIFMRASLNDSQVPYWEAAKFAATFRSMQQGANPVLAQFDLETGHAGASGRYDALREVAQSTAFMLAQWGLAEPPGQATLPTAAGD